MSISPISHMAVSGYVTPGPLRPGVTVSVRVSSRGQTELFNHLLDFKPFNFGQTNN